MIAFVASAITVILANAYVRYEARQSEGRFTLHYYLPQQNCFDKAESSSWYARFDNIPLPTPEPTVEQAAPGGRCEGGQPCPQSGFWWTPAKKGAERHFEQGEVMPDFPSSKYGDTIWYLDTV